MRASVLLILAALAAGAAGETAAADPAALNRAAALYHEGRHDSARVRLESLLAESPSSRRDSLMLLQYLGMAHSRRGEDTAAVARFRELLSLDSLFRFPRNEDPAVARNFEAARRERLAQKTVAAPEPVAGGLMPVTPVPIDAVGTTSAAPVAGPGARSLPPATAEAPLAVADPRPRPMSIALGAVPLGAGWLARGQTAHGAALGILQVGGLLLALHASSIQSGIQGDAYGLEAGERERATRWQWTQRISLSTALGAYLYSIIAAGEK
ncbi:MAG TPA: hypothetical protein VK465_16405 [Fibrobacteria bacterium]|nr:hypothetical protein [Fibrobacteria bacterium]